MMRKNKRLFGFTKRRFKKTVKFVLGLLMLVFSIWLISLWKPQFFFLLKGLLIIILLLASLSMLFLSWTE